MFRLAVVRLPVGGGRFTGSLAPQTRNANILRAGLQAAGMRPIFRLLMLQLKRAMEGSKHDHNVPISCPYLLDVLSSFLCVRQGKYLCPALPIKLMVVEMSTTSQIRSKQLFARQDALTIMYLA